MVAFYFRQDQPGAKAFSPAIKKTTKPKQKARDVELCQAWAGERVFAFLFRLYINDAL